MRAARRTLLLAATLPLGACGIWPWSSSGPKLPELPPLTEDLKLRQVWKASLAGAGIGFQPRVAGESIIAADRAGTIVRLDAASGRTEWRTDLDEPLVTGVGTDGATTVAGTRDGRLVALDSEGRQKWAVPNGAEIATVPAVGMGLVVVRGSNNRVVAYELETGRRRWAFDRQPPALVLRQTASAVMDPLAVYVGLPGGRLVALSLDSGALLWEAAVGLPRGSNEIERIADVVGSPRLGAGQVCAAAWQGRVACYDGRSGRVAWSRELAAAAGLDLDSQLLVTVDSQGDVNAFTRTGASMWRQDSLRRREPSAPLLTGTHVVVGDSLGLLHALSRYDGALVGRLQTDGTAIVAAPVAWRELAIAQTRRGDLYAVAME